MVFRQNLLEIQSNYDSSMREIEFDQRQYQNFQTVVETNELYQEGERGFFGNPIPRNCKARWVY